MMLYNGIMKALSFCLLIMVLGLGLAACSAAPKKSDTYMSGSGAVMYLDNDQEACTRSCNAEFDRCGDSRAAQEQVGRSGQMTGVFGGQADCKDDMRSCLSRCKASR